MTMRGLWFDFRAMPLVQMNGRETILLHNCVSCCPLYMSEWGSPGKKLCFKVLKTCEVTVVCVGEPW